MQTLFPKKPFYEKLEFSATLRASEFQADQLHIVIEYPSNVAGEIKGFVVGDSGAYNRMSRIFNHSAINIQLSETPTTGGQRRILSDSLRLKSTGDTRWPEGYGNSMQSIIAEFNLHDLTVEQDLQGDFPAERNVIFSLAGPRSFWPVSFRPELDEIGTFKANVINEEWNIEIDFPANVTVRPSYMVDTSEGTRTQLLTDILVIQIKTSENQNSLSDNKFVELSTNFVDDIVLLTSFISGTSIEWYKRELFTQAVHQSYLKEDTRLYTERVDRDQLLIDPLYAHDFFRIALPEYRRLRQDNFDLFYPLLYFIGGNEARYLEEKFTLFYFALEKVRDLYAAKNNFQDILSHDDFAKLKNGIRDVLSRVTLSSDRLKWIESKIPELNRPPVRQIIEEKMFQELNVAWKDLYPPGADLSIFNTRNKLFHTAERPDINIIADETERIKFIVARLLLRLLGWRGRANAPPEYMLKWFHREASSGA